MKHELDSNGSSVMGDNAERKFWITLVKSGYSLKKIRKADKHEEQQHIDFVVDGIKYEVKAMKRLQRGGSVQDKYTWVELTNWVGLAGWLYGRADKIAFEIHDGFVVVSLAKLRALVEAKVGKSYTSSDELIHCPDKAVYRLYSQRQQKKTRLTLIPMSDIMTIADSVIS